MNAAAVRAITLRRRLQSLAVAAESLASAFLAHPAALGPLGRARLLEQIDRLTGELVDVEVLVRESEKQTETVAVTPAAAAAGE
jgi:hypothetical protein